MIFPIIQFIILLVLVKGLIPKPFQLISTKGNIVTVSQLTKQFDVNDDLGDSVAVSMFNILDCTHHNLSIINNVFSCSFAKDSGVQIQFNAHDSIISYAPLQTSKISNIIDFYSQISSSLCVVLSYSDLNDTLRGLDHTFRRLMSARSDQFKRKSILFLLDCTSEPMKTAVNVDTVKGILASYLESIWNDMLQTETLIDIFDWNVVVVDCDNPVSVQAARKEVTDAVGAASPSGPRSALATELVDKWNELHANQLPILTKSQTKSLFEVELAYSENMRRLNSVLSQWHSRISQGKILSDFGVRASVLLDSLQENFNDRTAGAALGVRSRGERFHQLVEHATEQLTKLRKQQVLNVADEIKRDFKRSLVRMANIDDVNSVDFGRTALKSSLSQFDARVSNLFTEIKSSELLTHHQQELLVELHAILENFPESAAAKLSQMRQLDRISKKQAFRATRSKRARALQISMSVIAMLKPAGHGNLQGVINYATRLMGMPVDLTLGVQNDGESMEVLDEDRDSPLLRIQPKFHFDVDL